MPNAWPLKARQALALTLVATIFGVSLASVSYAVTSIGTDISTDGALTVSGNLSLNDADADTLLIGQNAGTPDVVTIAGNVSLSDAQWSISAAGGATFASVAGDGASLSNLDADDIATGTLNDGRLSSNVAHLNADETIAANWVNTANPWADNEVADSLTIGASGSVNDGALSSTVANLDAAETITANWVNTANPWADNEVADNLTLSGGTASVTSLTVGSGTAISRHLSVSQANVTSASIAATACGNYATVTVTNAAVGDAVSASPSPATNGIEDVNLSWSAFVSAADTVTIRACNPQTVTAIDTDNSQTWRVDVWQH